MSLNDGTGNNFRDSRSTAMVVAISRNSPCLMDDPRPKSGLSLAVWSIRCKVCTRHISPSGGGRALDPKRTGSTRIVSDLLDSCDQWDESLPLYRMHQTCTGHNWCFAHEYSIFGFYPDIEHRNMNHSTIPRPPRPLKPSPQVAVSIVVAYYIVLGAQVGKVA